MNNVFPLLLILFLAFEGFCQTDEVGLATAVGQKEGAVSLSWGKNWGLGKNKKITIGVGGRLTSYFGSDQHYITAPAKLTSGSTGPLVIFKENIRENIDTLFISSAQANALNGFINFAYSFSKKLVVGFNIDVVGLTIGKQNRGTFISDTQPRDEYAKPTLFNVLLISDNDRGTLNSELYGQYFWHEKLALKLGAQFLFTEYTTETKAQKSPEPNDRFRNKSLMFMIGLVCKL
jgi:hypothetical protein